MLEIKKGSICTYAGERLATLLWYPLREKPYVVMSKHGVDRKLVNYDVRLAFKTSDMSSIS